MTTQVFFPPFDTWATSDKTGTSSNASSGVTNTADPPMGHATYLKLEQVSSNNLVLPAERDGQRSADVERMQDVVEGGGPSTPSLANESMNSTYVHRQVVGEHAQTTTSPPRHCRRRGLSGDRPSVERIHKRGTSLGLLPLYTSFDTSPQASIKTHRRTLSTATTEQRQQHTLSPLRTILSDSTSQANMLIRRAPPTSARKTDAEAEVDRQRGFELVMSLMGDADLISESDVTSKEGGFKSLSASFSPKGQNLRRKHKSADATPSRLTSSERSSSMTREQPGPQHRPGGSLHLTATRSDSAKPRPPPLRELPLPSWSCPGPSPPLTSLAQPFPSEFFIVHVPSPINDIGSPPPSPFSPSSTSMARAASLRRRRSSLSSFESMASTIRPWDLQGEITPKPSRTQLVRLRVHEACEDPILRRPLNAHRAHTTSSAGDWQRIIAMSEEEQRTTKKPRRTFEAFPAYEDFQTRTRCPTKPLSPLGARDGKSTAARGRRRGRSSEGNAVALDVVNDTDIRSAAWWEGLGGWLGKERN